MKLDSKPYEQLISEAAAEYAVVAAGAKAANAALSEARARQAALQSERAALKSRLDSFAESGEGMTDDEFLQTGDVQRLLEIKARAAAGLVAQRETDVARAVGELTGVNHKFAGRLAERLRTDGDEWAAYWRARLAEVMK